MSIHITLSLPGVPMLINVTNPTPQTLAAARKLQTPTSLTKIMDLNPKSIRTEELYGFISMATREWKDGLLSKASCVLLEFKGCISATFLGLDVCSITASLTMAR